jgi:hypothetical protein
VKSSKIAALSRLESQTTAKLFLCRRKASHESGNREGP